MKKNRKSIFITLTTLIIVGMLFSFIPQSYAQNSQVWTEPINLSNAGSSTNPTMVVDAIGRIHAVWFDQFDGYKYTKSADGVNWDDPKTVRFPFSPTSLDEQPNVPLLFADNNDRIFALWIEEQRNSNALYYSSVSVPADRDLTTSWANRTRLADSVLDFHAVISSQGILHVGYVSSIAVGTNPAGIYYLQIGASNRPNAINIYPSQYYRSLQPEDANVHLAVANKREVETVYIVWDDRYQHKILLSKSLDGGNLWENPIQVGETGDDSSSPFNININVIDDKVLLLWQLGVPGNQCAQYSQWSTDGANQFDAPIKMLAESAGCPQTSDILMMSHDFSVVSLNLLGDISLLAWDGANWSNSRIQNEISTFINPVTFDNVVLGCQKMYAYGKKLYIVGCDEGSVSDIWFSSRTLGTVKDWFPPSSVWSAPVEINFANQQAMTLFSIADGDNTVHTFLTMSPEVEGNTSTAAIQYIGWHGKDRSTPVSVITGFNGMPVQLDAESDRLKRLLLAWVNSSTGDILFTRAETSRANVASEWEIPRYIPSLSQANSSPNILVDDAGKIIVAYAISINERRGIYFVESEDGGLTWTQPFQIFDAVAAGWDIVDQPIISLTGDGRFHLLFERFSLQGIPRRSSGLYYAQSFDGGRNWSEPELVTENPVLWNEIVAFDQATVHRLWQEERQSNLVSFHQVSFDSGMTWSVPAVLSSMSSNSSSTALTMDKIGNLHFLELASKDNLLNFNHRIWNGMNWVSSESKEVYVSSGGVASSITAAVTSGGDFRVSFLIGYPDPADQVKSSVMSLEKTLEFPAEIEPVQPSIIPTAVPTMVGTEEVSNEFLSPTSILPTTVPPTTIPPTHTLVPTTTGGRFSLPSKFKNIAGLLLVGGLLFLISIIFLPAFWKRNKSKNK